MNDLFYKIFKGSNATPGPLAGIYQDSEIT